METTGRRSLSQQAVGLARSISHGSVAGARQAAGHVGSFLGVKSDDEQSDVMAAWRALAEHKARMGQVGFVLKSQSVEESERMRMMDEVDKTLCRVSSDHAHHHSLIDTMGSVAVFDMCLSGCDRRNVDFDDDVEDDAVYCDAETTLMSNTAHVLLEPESSVEAESSSPFRSVVDFTTYFSVAGRTGTGNADEVLVQTVDGPGWSESDTALALAGEEGVGPGGRTVSHASHSSNGCEYLSADSLVTLGLSTRDEGLFCPGPRERIRGDSGPTFSRERHGITPSSEPCSSASQPCVRSDRSVVSPTLTLTHSAELVTPRPADHSRPSNVSFSPVLQIARFTAGAPIKRPDGCPGGMRGVLKNRCKLHPAAAAAAARDTEAATPTGLRSPSPAKSILKHSSDYQNICESPNPPKENVSLNAGNDSLLYRTDGLRYYKDLIEVEKRVRLTALAEKKAELEAKITDKQTLIMELLELTKAHYFAPHGVPGSGWQSLVRKLRGVRGRGHSRPPRQRGGSRVYIRRQLQQLPLFTPYFTWIICLWQLVAFIVLFSLGGMRSVGLEPELRLQTGVTTFLGLETLEHWHQHNIWIGPPSVYLISIGAVYAPCMREDIHISLLYSKQFGSNISEAQMVLGCCEVVARNTAGTTTQRQCLTLTGGVGSWLRGVQCRDRPVTVNWQVQHNMRPCCYGVKGQCQLTSHQHCTLLEGQYFADGPDHCSQVNCLSHLCKMGGLEAAGERPYQPRGGGHQWWRVLLSLLYHHGLVHVGLVLPVQYLLARPIEVVGGWLRVCIIYVTSGALALMVGAVFKPYSPHVGGGGAVFGLLAVSLTELLQAWTIVHAPWWELTKLTAVALLFLLSGTLPWVDNFELIAGFVFGAVTGVIFLPYLTFGKWHARFRLALICALTASVLLLAYTALYVFYHVQTVLELCDSCRLIDCVPYTKTLCNNTDLW